MWKLYDDLCVGIPSGILVEGCVVGKTWTVVRANGNIGMAHTLGSVEDAPAFAAGFLNKPLRDVGNHMRWTDLPTASVGVAALNCYYTTADRVEGLDGAREKGPMGVPFSREELAGKKVALVGEIPHMAQPEGCTLTKVPCPMAPELDDQTKAALAGQEVLIVSGDALTTRALPALLDLVGEQGTVAVCGVGVPSTALFFAFDMPVRVIEGFYPRFPSTMEASALLDLQDLTAGLLPFRIVPMAKTYLHQSDLVDRSVTSPYKASAFNQQFNQWEGKQYDQSQWSELYMG